MPLEFPETDVVVSQFREWDENGDGRIDRATLLEVLVSVGVPEFHASKLVAPFSSKEGIDYVSFLKKVCAPTPAEQEALQRGDAGLDVSDEYSKAADANSSLLAKIQFLSKVPLLRRLPPDLMPIVATACTRIEFDEDIAVVQEGSFGESFFLIESGSAKVTRAGKFLASLAAGDYFGEKALLHNEARVATVTAETPLSCLELTRDKFRELGLNKKLHFANRNAVAGGRGKENVPPPTPKTPQERELIARALRNNVNLQQIVGDEQAECIIESAWKETVEAGTCVIKLGDLNAEYFYIVQEGKFEVAFRPKKPKDAARNIADASKDAALDKVTLGKGSSFGELALLHAAPRAATVTALERSELWVVSRQQFKDILKQVCLEKAHDHVKYLDSVEILSPLLKEERAALAEALVEMTFLKEEVVLQQGEKGDTFYILCDGSVEIVVDGQVMSSFSASRRNGDAKTFGERALLSQEARAATVKVTSDTAEVLALSREAFTTLLGPLHDLLEGVHRGVQQSIDEVPKKSTGHLKRSDLKKLGMLGCGGFGAVELVEHTPTGETFALKAVSKGLIMESGCEASILNEKNVLLMANCPFIINLHETYNGAQNVYFLLDVALGGELYSTYQHHGLFGLEPHARYYAGSVVCAFEYLHSRHIMYRDLKPENLLLTETGRVKVTDMGLAKFALGKTFTCCGTPDYFSPEMITSSGHTKAVDWWTLGVVIYELMTGFPPFRGDTPMETYDNVMLGIEEVYFPAEVHGTVQQVIKGLLHGIPAMRLPMRPGGTGNIRHHGWYSGFDWSKLEDLSMEPPFLPKVASKTDRANFDDWYFRMPRRVPYFPDGSGWDESFATMEDDMAPSEPPNEEEDASLHDMLDEALMGANNRAKMYKEIEEAQEVNRDLAKKIKFLSQVPLLKRLPKDQMPILASAVERVTFDKGVVVFEEGSFGSHFYMIEQGSAEVMKGGKSVITLTVGDYFGEKALLQNEARSATIMAKTAMSCLELTRAKFWELGLNSKLAFANRKAVADGFKSKNVAPVEVTEKTDAERAFIIKAITSNENLDSLVDEEQANSIADVASTQTIAAGTRVIEAGDLKADFFYIVQEGSFEVSVPKKTGKSSTMTTVVTLGTGECFGELALLYSAPRSATVQATTESVVWTISRQDFKTVLRQVCVSKTHQYVAYIDSVDILSSLLKQEKEALAEAMAEMRFMQGEEVLRQGEPGDTFYILFDGEVDVFVDGKCVNQLHANPVELTARAFGERALLADDVRTATIKVTSEDAKVLTLDRRAFDLLLGPLRDILDGVHRGVNTEMDNKATTKTGHFLKKDLVHMGLLGCGGFGAVELCKHGPTSQVFALKAISKGYILECGMEEGVMNEKNILLMANSQFIINLHECYNGAQYCYFLLDAALGGELYALYHMHDLFGCAELAQFYSAVVVCAFEYLHERHIIYRDLKPENLLLTETGRVKLTDMGLAKFVIGKTYTCCGTPDYFSPEIITSAGHSKAVDWWTLGNLIFELMSGSPPFRGNDAMETYDNVMAGIEVVYFPPECEGDLQDLVCGLLAQEPELRLPVRPGGTQNLRSHAWYTVFDWQGLVDETLEPPFKPPKVEKGGTSEDFCMPTRVPYVDPGTGWDIDFATVYEPDLAETEPPDVAEADLDDLEFMDDSPASMYAKEGKAFRVSRWQDDEGEGDAENDEDD